MLGIVITSYNRPEYLHQCLHSLYNADIPPGLMIIMVDDASDDLKTNQLFDGFWINDVPIVKIKNKTNSRISRNLLTGFNKAFELGCNRVMNLDGDVIVRKDFIAKLTALHDVMPEHIITGFNCLTRNKNGSERHPIVKEFNGFSLKKHVTGINMLMNEDTFRKYMEPSLNATLNGGNWDHLTGLAATKDEKLTVCTVPSVVQHIGLHSSLGHTDHEAPDVADDFRELCLPNVTLITAGGIDLRGMIRAMNASAKNIDFGQQKILTHLDSNDPRVIKIRPLKSKEDYSQFFMKELYQFVDTDFALTVQSDGYVMNPSAWTKEFFNFDYIGAPWKYKDGMNVGNGGFSLRSRKLLKALHDDESMYVTYPEDHHICRTYRKQLENNHGIKFADEKTAKVFSFEGYGQPGKHYTNQFGFHGTDVKIPMKNNNTYIINQFQGLGDIIFSMALAEEWIKKGYEIIWTVIPEFMTLQKHFPKIEFVDKNKFSIDYNSKKFDQLPAGTLVPLYFAHQILKAPYTACMRSKYDLFGADWKMWRNVSWVRDAKKEQELFALLGLKKGDKYTLVNRYFRSDKTGRSPIPAQTGIVIDMHTIEGFTLLDWSKVIENADVIHTVGTSINYVIEILSCKAREIHLYVRKPEEKDFSYYDYILTNKYNYIMHG